jgi:hypothetical protein
MASAMNKVHNVFVSTDVSARAAADNPTITSAAAAMKCLGRKIMLRSRA